MRGLKEITTGDKCKETEVEFTNPRGRNLQNVVDGSGRVLNYCYSGGDYF